MDLEQIKKILDLMRDNDLAEFELEQDGVKVRLRKHSGPAEWSAAPEGSARSAPAQAPPASSTPPQTLTVASEDVDLAIIKSPIVGTFYRSAEPGAPAFVDVGDAVRKGQVLCIIEAMKLMNEIESEVRGKIVKALVENAQPVEFGQTLFLVDPS